MSLSSMRFRPGNGAAKLVFELAAAPFEDEGGDEIEGVAFEDMTPAQRVVYRARLQKLLERSEEELEELFRTVNERQDNGRTS
jgi:hypothetical protein